MTSDEALEVELMSPFLCLLVSGLDSRGIVFQESLNVSDAALSFIPENFRNSQRLQFL